MSDHVSNQSDTGASLVTVRAGRHNIVLHTAGPADLLHKRLVRARAPYEYDVLTYCAQTYIPGTSVIDVGANIGNHAVFLAKVLNARVIAFEPNPATVALLRQNIAANNCDQLVAVRDAAVGDESRAGHMVSGRRGNEGGEAKFVPGDGPVPQVRLDDALDRSTPVSIVKIDVEGMELPVLRGATGLLARFHPHIFVEAHGDAAFLEIARHLLPAGYLFAQKFANDTFLFTARDPAARQQALLAAIR